MTSSHIRMQVQAYTHYGGQICPITHTKLIPGTWIVLCEQKDTSISWQGWREFIQTDWQGVCPFCASPAPVRPPMKPTSHPPRSRSTVSVRTPAMQSVMPEIKPRSLVNSFDLPFMTTGLLLVLVMGCSIGIYLLSLLQVVDIEKFNSTNQNPRSAFVHHQDNLQVGVEQEMRIESYHIGYNKLSELKIFINKQPLSDFPAELATIQVQNGKANQVDHLTLSFPSTTWDASFVWIGHTPGTYELSLVVTDDVGQESEPVVQWIEVR